MQINQIHLLLFLLAAKIMLLLNPTNNTKAIEFLTTLDPNFTNQNLKVSFKHIQTCFMNKISFQTCSTIYENMKQGDYGVIENSILEKYRTECQRFWPKANLFKTAEQSQSSPASQPLHDIQTNGGNSGST